MIIPSIDLIDGKAVQLKQGKEKVLEREDVLDLAKEFSKYGEIAVIDLDAALDKGENIDIIKEICKIADCRVGGGIRTLEKAQELLSAGAKKIIIGTKATPDFLKELPKDRLIAAIDTAKDVVVDKGWTRKTKKTPFQMISELENYCSEFLFTNVQIEGMMKGIDLNAVKMIRKATKNKITAAGGISSIKDVKELEKLNVNSQIGMAIYTNAMKLDDAFISVLDFRKGPIPTIVQDTNKQVLMLAYSSIESLKKTFNIGKATYFSRSRDSLWTKGETSGNFQEFITARYDCDRDSLLFTVKQTSVACHLNNYSCFGDKEFGINSLFNVIQDRMSTENKESYTNKIARDAVKLKSKIMEEAEEVVKYTNRDNLIWEIADLTYFVSILMAKNKIMPKEIINELWRRRK